MDRPFYHVNTAYELSSYPMNDGKSNFQYSQSDIPNLAPSRDTLPKNRSWQTSLAIIFLLTVTVCVLGAFGFVISLILRDHLPWTTTAPIGGSFSQTWAKIVDFVAGAVLAPILMALINFALFQVIRTSAIDERGGGRISLNALVEISTTNWGSYSVRKFATLVRTLEARIILVAFVTLLSAVSFTTLCNVVAYEAFVATGELSTATLQSLHVPVQIHTYDTSWYHNFTQLPEFTTQQEPFFASQYFSMMTALSYAQVGDELVEGAYIGINITNASLALLPTNITALYDVPAYRLTYDCAPATPIYANLEGFGFLWQLLDIEIVLGPQTSNDTFQVSHIYDAFVLDGTPSIVSSISEICQYVAFAGPSEYGPAVTYFLGQLESFNSSGSATFSDFGDSYHYGFDNSPLFAEYGLLDYARNTSNNNLNMSTYGVECSIKKQEGLVDMKRDASANWKRSAGTFSSESEVLPLILADLQAKYPYASSIVNSVGQQAMPGLGGALAASTNLTEVLPGWDSLFLDFRGFANNYLYAEGEARRIAYEVALSGNNRTYEPTVLNVSSTSDSLRYRMTYVPGLLLAGLLAVALASSITCGIALYARKSYLFRTGRTVSPLRLIADAVNGLDHEVFEKTGTWGHGRLDKWGQSYTVSYQVSGDQVSGQSIRLQAAGGGREETLYDNL